MKTPISGKANRARTAYLAQYQTQLGIQSAPRRRLAINEPFMRDLAEAWQDARHAPSDPIVSMNYERFTQETLLQFRFLEEEGIRFEQTTNIAPYAKTIDLVRDIEVHDRVLIWSGGTLPDDHPLGVKGRVPGHPDWRTLDALRGVHEVFGHAVGNSFTTRLGEDLAFQDHRRLYTTASWPTLTTEFRAPLAWLMFGPHLDRSAPLKWLELPYPPQKAVGLPAQYWSGKDAR